MAWVEGINVSGQTPSSLGAGQGAQLALAKKLRVVIVTNIPVPYRLPVYALLAQESDIDFHVVYCSGREPDREWNLEQLRFSHTFLKSSFMRYRSRYIHFNHDVWSVLQSLKPDIVVTTGFNPTHIMAYVWTRLHGARHVAMTDGTLESEVRLSTLHRWVRRHVYTHTAAFIGASDGAMRLYQSYGINSSDMFKSHLCADNALFFNVPLQAKVYDFIFCGRFEAVKSPLFAMDVARATALRLGRRVSMVLLGSGSLEGEMRSYAKTIAADVEVVFAGFAKQEALPGWYGASRIFLFPTRWDPWGVVANEACAAGVPMLISDVAGAVGELVQDGDNGFVLPLERECWTDAAVRLLTDKSLYAVMAVRCRERVGAYHYANAARGIMHAVRAADRACLSWSTYTSSVRPKVVIVQRRMTQYRLPLFNLMREKLDAVGVELIVIYGDPLPSEKLKADSGELPWGIYVPCRYWFNGRLCWQNAMPVVSNANMVVVTQENKLLFNYVRSFLKKNRKWAFWGHGRNFQSASQNSLSERFKRWSTKRMDWWFAYTQMSADRVMEVGFQKSRITVLNNAVDTFELCWQRQSITPEELCALRVSLGFGTGPAGVYVGSLYIDKRLDFLFAAAEAIRRKVPDFHLLIVGEGPERDKVQAWCVAHPWARWVGTRFGREKVAYVSVARVMMNPGLVGLGILDSFVCGVPMLTTDCGIHSPEIAYLENGINGVMTADDLDAYVNASVCLLRDDKALDVLRSGCAVSAAEYTVENMACQFVEGVTRCLAASHRDWRAG